MNTEQLRELLEQKGFIKQENGLNQKILRPIDVSGYWTFRNRPRDFFIVVNEYEKTLRIFNRYMRVSFTGEIDAKYTNKIDFSDDSNRPLIDKELDLLCKNYKKVIKKERLRKIEEL